MDIFRTAETDLGLSREEIRAALLESLEGRSLKKVLILPPDISRFHSGAGSNDLTMIQEAGIGVAMARSWAPLKEAADYITADCNDSGVGKAIRKFCL